MSKLSLYEKYQMLVNQCTSPKSSDCIRSTIYRFDKWCKCCNAGMAKPVSHEKKSIKSLFRKGFCSERCSKSNVKKINIGSICSGKHEGFVSSFSRTSHDDQHIKPDPTKIEDMVSLSIAVDRMDKKMPPFAKLIRQAEFEFNLLSEKLSFLEMSTGDTWGSSKYYFWLNKI